jgi:hypothetical protein
MSGLFSVALTFALAYAATKRFTPTAVQWLSILCEVGLPALPISVVRL